MICELIAVGTEILLGEIANTDAQILSQGLSEYGFSVYYHTVCGDNPDRLKKALEIAKNRADIIITTGGLGPTADDLTKETIASAFGLSLYLDEGQHKRLLARMGSGMTKNNEKQAWLPEGCTVLENDWGTAPGCAFFAQDTHVIMLPGPPRECKPMFYERAIPYLQKLIGGVIQSSYIKLFGIGESDMESRLAHLMSTWENPTAAPYAKEGECEVRVTAFAESQEKAQEMLQPAVSEICSILNEFVYGIDVPSLEAVVVKGLSEKGLCICAAESCTGGLINKRLTDIPGASACVKEGFITYSNEAKVRRLNVQVETLEQFGAVSEQTALEMARGAKKASGADIGVGVTGVAGPDGGSEEKPVGMVYCAICGPKGEKVVCKVRKNATRERVRTMAASTALDLVRREYL